jgi:hypothetical protein
MKDDLEQEIAQLLLEVGEVVPGDRVRDLISLFERIGRDGRKILRQIPRAAGPRRTPP